MNHEVFRLYTEELIGEKDCYRTNSKGIRLLTINLDPTEQWYHVEDDTIWRKKAWLTHFERISQLKRESDLFNQKVFKRKEILDELRKGIATYLNMSVDDDNCFQLALKIMKNRNHQAAFAFGVSLEGLPELEKKYTIMNGERSYEL